MTRPLSILCFVVDQMRADHLGCMGNPDVRTPNLDALAARGALFTESFVANPVCMPNRASMFTGQYPRAHGLRQNGYSLHPERIVLPELLRQAGWRTGCFGKLHLSDWGGSPDDIARTAIDRPHEIAEARRLWDAGGRPATPHYGLEDLWIADGHGNYIFGDYRNELLDEDPRLYDLLQPAQALRNHGTHESWVASIPPEKHYNTRIAERCGAWIRDLDAARPFFAWCSFPDPHHPYCPPEPWASRHDPARVTFAPRRREGELADLPAYCGEISRHERRMQCHNLRDDEYREVLAHTYGMIEMVDACVGRVLADLAAAGRADDTVVVFTSDHGDLMGDHWLNKKGPFLFRGLVRVPHILCLPGAAPQVSDALVSTVDLAPTLLDAVGLPVPRSMHGRSVAGVARGGRSGHRDAICIEYDNRIVNQRQLRTRDWAITVDIGEDGGLLFDLRCDPDELRNLWHDPACRAERDRLRLRLLDATLAADDWYAVEACPQRRNQSG